MGSCRYREPLLMKTTLVSKDCDAPRTGPVEVAIAISPEQLRLRETPFGAQVDGEGYDPFGEPGGPAFPARFVRVVVPNTTSHAISLTVEASKVAVLSENPVVLAPLPDLQVGNGSQPKEPSSPCLEKDAVTRMKSRQETQGSAIPSKRAVTEPNLAEYRKRFEQPYPVAEITSITTLGESNVVAIRIMPVHYDGQGRLVVHTEIKLTIRAGEAPNDSLLFANPRARATIQAVPVSVDQHNHLVETFRDTVINPNALQRIPDFKVPILVQATCLIITDNNTWDAKRITPVDPVGDLVTEFEKLAAWKRLKGLTARVVTITQIVNGRYGDFVTGARDLPEVIRNFLKFARRNWGTEWLLLGGDANIVPVRYAAGEIRGDISPQSAENPPPRNAAFWTGSFLKINLVDPGEWFSVHDDSLQLTNQVSGIRIPKKTYRPRYNFGAFESTYLDSIQLHRDGVIAAGAAGSGGSPMGALARLDLTRPLELFTPFETLAECRSRVGWYFCTSNSYLTYSATPTNFVRVDGPEGLLNAQLRFHYRWNTIPTDFYYASLIGPQYDQPGRRDWDFNGNGIYGQNEGATHFDPINWHADLSVGRAAASNPTDAATFVRKVITYEKFERADGTRLDRDYLDKMAFFSSNWGGRLGFGAGSGDNTYSHAAGANHTVIRLAPGTATDMLWQLIAWVNDGDVRLLAYDRTAQTRGAGWHYAVSPTDLTPSGFNIPIPWGGPLFINWPSDTIVVYGNGPELSPMWYVLDRLEADGSMMDQEALRTQVGAELPLIRRVTRLYEDLQSLPPANLGAGPVQQLIDGNVWTAVNGGQHFVSLSGHGSPGGCCGVDTSKAAFFSNQDQCFIGYADSCLTCAFEADDWGDGASERLVNNPAGGAVAYVGSTRFSWIGWGDDYQRTFFHELRVTRHLGRLHDSRLRSVQADPNNHGHRWISLSLNLIGDPEMQVWTFKPARLWIKLDLHEAIVRVRLADRADLTQKPLKDAQVTIRRGDDVQRFTPSGDGYVDIPRKLVEGADMIISAPGFASELRAIRKLASPEPDDGRDDYASDLANPSERAHAEEHPRKIDAQSY